MRDASTMSRWLIRYRSRCGGGAGCGRFLSALAAGGLLLLLQILPALAIPPDPDQPPPPG